MRRGDEGAVLNEDGEVSKLTMAVRADLDERLWRLGMIGKLPTNKEGDIWQAAFGLCGDGSAKLSSTQT